MSEQQPKAKFSDNERLKGESHFLRGTIAQDLQDGLTGGFNGDNFQLIRFHGMYQQDYRNLRAEAKLEYDAALPPAGRGDHAAAVAGHRRVRRRRDFLRQHSPDYPANVPISRRA